MSYKQKFVYTDNHGQNIWNKVKKSNKAEQEQKILITASVQFLTAITEVLFSIHILFLIFSYFLRSYAVA